jgi:hypothetical protein
MGLSRRQAGVGGPIAVASADVGSDQTSASGEYASASSKIGASPSPASFSTTPAAAGNPLLARASHRKAGYAK